MLFRYGLRYSDTPAESTQALDPNAPYLEDDCDDGAEIVDPLERDNLPQQRKFMSAREFHKYLMAERRDNVKDQWHWLWDKGPLAEQYALGTQIQIEQHEQEHVKDHQKVCRFLAAKQFFLIYTLPCRYI
jgi:hypothetical protein